MITSSISLCSLLDGLLLPNAIRQLSSDGDVVLSGISSDSRDVGPGMLFVAVPGPEVDGRDFIKAAIAQGAIAIIKHSNVESVAFDYSTDSKVIVIEMPALAAKLGLLAAKLYQRNYDFPIVGITGTNGKTTTSWLLAKSLENLSQKTALIGTLGFGCPDSLTLLNNTTPGSVQLHQILSKFSDEGVDAVAMEVSSIGVDQHRISGVPFSVAVMTNLSRDHLDYHKTMDAYASAKKAFLEQASGRIVLNIDDEVCASWVSEFSKDGREVMSYGCSAAAQESALVSADLSKKFWSGLSTQWVLNLNGVSYSVSSLMPGDFNISNHLAVVASLLALGYNDEDIVVAIQDLTPPPGRMQVCVGSPVSVVVDYAHTPDALEKLLQTFMAVPDQHLALVFGCGGDRDSGKRSQMAAIAEKYSDSVFVTSDNPRAESLGQIFSDIKSGFSKKANVQFIDDREDAISTAINLPYENLLVAVAGKGHEVYQETNGIKKPFDDMLVAKKFMTERGAICM